MTVGEAIKQLEKFNPDLPLCVFDFNVLGEQPEVWEFENIFHQEKQDFNKPDGKADKGDVVCLGF